MKRASPPPKASGLRAALAFGTAAIPSALKRGPGKRKTVSFSANLTTVLRKPAARKSAAAAKPARKSAAAAKPFRKSAAAAKPARKRAARKPARKAAAAKPARKRAARKPARKAPRKPAAGKPVRRIDFSKIRWGTFTARFNSWKRRHPRARVNTLREFAAYILTHPDKFSLRARRKALFYRNIILKGRVPMRIAKYHGRKSRTTATRKRSRTAARRVKREASPRLLSPPTAHRPRKVRM